MLESQVSAATLIPRPGVRDDTGNATDLDAFLRLMGALFLETQAKRSAFAPATAV